MAAGVQAWTVAWIVCLASHAHAQLGVGDVGGGDGTGDTPTTTTSATITDQLIPGGHEEGNEGGNAAPEVLVADEWRWRPLEETYQGCFKEDNFNGTLMFVNLSEVMNVQQVESQEEACFHMCLKKEPFSTYIAVSPSVSSSGGDGCGCKDYLDFSNEVDGEGCDEVLRHYRAYCGPSNFECLNRAGHTTTASTFLLISALVTLLLACFSQYEA